MKLRVCQIIPTLVQGGAEKQMSMLATNLNQDRFESHVITLTHTGPLESQLLQAGVRVHHVGKQKKLDPLAMWRLKQTLRQIAPHVVHTWLFAGNSYGRVAARWARVPVIVASERCVDPWKGQLHYWTDKWLAGSTSRLVTNSTGVVDFYSGRGIEPAKFQVIPNAVDVLGNSLTRNEVFLRLGLPPRQFLVGVVGRLWPQKGYPDLIWAAELLRIALIDPSTRSQNNLWVVIIGDGPEMQRLQELRDKYGAQEVVRFAGQRADARELISGLDVLWNGSLYEGQSNSMMEAMSAGVPVVASDIPGNRDLVVDKATGYLYELGDVGQLAQITFNLLQDEKQRLEMGFTGRQRMQSQFSTGRMVAAYSELYQELWDNRCLT